MPSLWKLQGCTLFLYGGSSSRFGEAGCRVHRLSDYHPRRRMPKRVNTMAQSKKTVAPTHSLLHAKKWSMPSGQ